MSKAEVQKVLDFAATLACWKGERQTPECPCPPCTARRVVSGKNDPVQIQEPLRVQVSDLERRLRDAEAALAASHKSEGKWISLMGKAKAERGEMRLERDAARAALRKLAEVADKLAQRSNGVTCGPRHQNTMTTGLMRLYNAQMAVEEALADPVVVAAMEVKPDA